MKNLAVVDLDGTLISNNSFKVWLKVLIFYSLKKLDLINLFKILFIILFRLFRIYSRSEMKSYLLSISIRSKYSRDVQEEIACQCITFLRNNLIVKINEAHFDYIAIASAAPLFYLESIIEKTNLPANIIIGSSFKDNKYFECVGENKKSEISKIVRQFNEKCKIYFYTDHYEDLPTATIADEIFLVDPSDITIKKFNQSNIKYSIIN